MKDMCGYLTHTLEYLDCVYGGKMDKMSLSLVHIEHELCVIWRSMVELSAAYAP